MSPWVPHLQALSHLGTPTLWAHSLHDTIQDYLQDGGDPRRDLVAKRWRGVGHGPFTQASDAAAGGGSQMPWYSHIGGYPTGDAGVIHMRRFEGQTPEAGNHWVVDWHPGGLPALVAPYTTHMPEEEFKEFLRTFPDPKAVLRTVKPAHHSTPKLKMKLAADRVPGVAAGIRDQQSGNHAARAMVARQILQEAGLSPALVRAALHHDGKAAHAALVQVISKKVDPARIKYAAAWYGLLSNSPAVTVFHPADSGEDTLHVISSPHSSDHVGAYLRRAGVPKFTTESHGAGTRAYVYDAGSQMRLENLAGGLDASHSKLPGVGYRIGNSPGAGPDGRADANARATYRTAITDYERS